ncbi:hypothetical protein [Bordetella genomosp. 1]|uniref:Uncharacterized protein n=1 Tax=Bordetella genomosp. 1 TaxID=1395607 RepID=A0ABX4ETV3_9BORD|nr:hypothetical protein [Bordetella genomosp. 1]OZI57200.1 hypothetical protein CAL27_23460 [Bordetella genomosp. 1]
MSSQPALTDLEDRLAAPGGAELRAGLAARVQTIGRRVRTELDAGLPRADFAAYSAVAAAADAAAAVLAAYPLAQEPGPAAGAPAQTLPSFTPR